MFTRVLEAIRKHNVSTLSEISEITGIDEKFVRIAVGYWRRKNKVNFQSAEERYAKSDCSTCLVRRKCHAYRKQKEKGGKNDFITYRKR